MSEWTFEEARAYVNMDHPELTSLLYDLGLMPGQIVGDDKRADMTLIVAHFMAAEDRRSGGDTELLERAWGALEHMSWCASCAESGWEECDGGKEAIAVVAALKARLGKE